MKDLNSQISEKFKEKNFEKNYLRTATFYKLADELLLLRKKRGYSQKELAEKAGTTQAVVSRLENASVKASLESVVNFAEALNALVDIHLVPLEDIRRIIENNQIDDSVTTMTPILDEADFLRQTYSDPRRQEELRQMDQVYSDSKIEIRNHIQEYSLAIN
jgi:transcriptional regulator with XRE-family HTH domain